MLSKGQKLNGKIIKALSGFYYVYCQGIGVVTCKAKGAFRNAKIKPLVGDDCSILLIDEKEKTGNVEEILPRKNELIRPLVSNVDMALLIFACDKPELNLGLLDRYLMMMESLYIPVKLCFNKSDLVDEAFKNNLRDIYEKAGYEIFFTCAKSGEGIEDIKDLLQGKTATVAGPSGAGKSTLVNAVSTEEVSLTGEVSDKIGRGRHTTRHVEIMPLGNQSFIVDTPGFSSVFLPQVKSTQLYSLFPEFIEHEKNCKFSECSHISEPICGVKDAVEEGLIAKSRYENYCTTFRQIKDLENRR